MGKKVTKEDSHEPTKAFDWQLYAEELEKECERLKRDIVQTQDYVNDLENSTYALREAIKSLINALHYIEKGEE
jgi:hypothetical protein